MAELATLARPYAEALYRVAKSGDLAQWNDLVLEMAQVAAHPDVRSFVSNPKLSNVQVTDTFLSLLRSNVSEQAKNFVDMLVQNDRLTLLPEIADQYHALKNADAGAADAEITSAYEMTDAQLNNLVATLERKFGRKLHPIVKVDHSLIGGVRVAVGDEVLDTSVRAKLQKMHTALTA
jgi:F-type H+-transporting ATPase subunit delta